MVLGGVGDSAFLLSCDGDFVWGFGMIGGGLAGLEGTGGAGNALDLGLGGSGGPVSSAALEEGTDESSSTSLLNSFKCVLQ